MVDSLELQGFETFFFLALETFFLAAEDFLDELLLAAGDFELLFFFPEVLDLFFFMLLARAFDTAFPSSSSDTVASLEWSDESSDSQEDEEESEPEELPVEDSFSVVLELGIRVLL